MEISLFEIGFNFITFLNIRTNISEKSSHSLFHFYYEKKWGIEIEIIGCYFCYEKVENKWNIEWVWNSKW